MSDKEPKLESLASDTTPPPEPIETPRTPFDLGSVEAGTISAPAVTATEAFMGSAGGRVLSFGGPDDGPCELKPFDVWREQAGLRMGVEFLRMASDARDEFAATGSYPGLLNDSVFVCWLCTRDLQTVKKAFHHPATYGNIAIEWAAKNQVRSFTARGGEVIEVFCAIMLELDASMAEPAEGKEAGADGDGLGEY